jgi:hypothetical protein
MEFSPEAIQSSTPKEAARILYEAGQALRGKSLRKGSWLEIAAAIRANGRTAEIVVQRLKAAKTREDALRVLRITRKWGSQAKAASTRRTKAAKAPALARPDDSEDEDWEWEPWDICECGNPNCRAHLENYLDWLATQSAAAPEIAGQETEVLPATSVQRMARDYALARRLPSADDERRMTIGSVIGEEAQRRLIALTREAAIELTAVERAYFERHSLTDWLRLADDPSHALPRTPMRVSDGYSLAAITLLVEKGLAQPPLHIKWDSVATWLIEKLRATPDDDCQATLRSFYEFCRLAPLDSIRRLLDNLATIHHAWQPMLFYLLQRSQELLPRSSQHPDALINTHLPWQQLLAAGFGSGLVLNNFKHACQDVFVRHVRAANRHQDGMVALLAAGAGTLHRMDYPQFSLTCRATAAGLPAVSMEILGEMVQVAHELYDLNERLTADSLGCVSALIDGWSRYAAQAPLPETTVQRVAEAVTAHAIAYVMLKEVTLREQMAQAPFRIRRKHIRRWWAEQGGVGSACLSIPRNLEELQQAFSLDLVKEGLVHALLDQLDARRPAGSGEDASLKEALIFALRMICLTYDFSRPWLPDFGVLREQDVDHGRDLADFMIKQMVHAPLEMAQALLIPHDQGFPLMLGGHLTPIEREGRRLLEQASGASARQLDGGATKTFTCRPLAKLAALERGTLGGDCSSETVPFRALSPHHTYYGIFENGVQQRGYMTVFEAWAQIDATGQKIPVLCLETINVPMRAFDAVQQDLLVIFDAIAASRGLYPRIVLITGIGTWNYQNGEVLRLSRRFRQGQPIHLSPADPIQWQLYGRLTAEARYYSSFDPDGGPWPGRRSTDTFRILAPFDPQVDLVQPENLAEARRLSAMPTRKLIVTAKTEEEAVGFISEMPA